MQSFIIAYSTKEKIPIPSSFMLYSVWISSNLFHLLKFKIYWLDATIHSVQISSVSQSCPTLCDPMKQHTRPHCPSLTSGVHSTSCPSSWWCHPNISSSVIAFSSCPQSLPASESFLMSRLFASGGQSIRASASASVFPVSIQDWLPLGWTGWISLQFKGLSRVFSNITFKSINSSVLSFLYSPTLTSIHDYWKNHSLD